MLNDRLREVRQGYADDACQGDEPPDLSPLRALAETEELADAVARLTNSYGRPLPAGDPLYPLAQDIARALTEAGLTLHHCQRNHSLYRLGGLCLLPILARHDTDGQGGIAVSWTTHDLLALDWDRGREHQGTQQTMNRALADVLRALGYQVRPFGTGGASLVTGHRAHDEETCQ